MEKKQNLRSNQLPAKVLNSESRKSIQDAPGKQQARHSRRREFSINCSQTQKTDRSYKQPQPRNVDKRNQVSRTNTIAANKIGNDASTSSARLNHSDDEYTEQISNEFQFEVNSVYLPGSKKQNLNHLLNFNYAPRDRMDSATYMRTGNIGRGYVKRIKYNKEQFVQANCQFVVSAVGDYKPYTISPDLLVNWSCVEQVNFFGGNEEPQCPICLYHPVAAKMTRCGHVYCWPCILHYLALSDKKSWRKCPICYEAVHIGDLKSAVSKPHHHFSCDETVTFQLMYRDKSSLQVHVAENDAMINIDSQLMFPFMSDDDERKRNSKLVLARSKEILTIIERERNELKCQLVSDGIDCADSIFVQQALDLLLEREESIRTKAPHGGNDADDNNFNETVSAKTVGNLMHTLANMNLNADAIAFVPSTINECVAESKPEPEPEPEPEMELEPSSDLNEAIEFAGSSLAVPNDDIDAKNSIPSNPDRLYFYQASDGQHLYLHSINVRMLQAYYGNLKHAPKTICGRILQKESFSMVEEFRKRLKYLNHLPVTCQFDVVEIEFESRDILTDDIRMKFKDELLQRQKNRQRRAREEHKREKHIDRENERRIGKIIRTAVNIDVTSDQQFPICGTFDEAGFAIQSSPITTEPVNIPTTGRSVPSFAKMLTSPQSGSNVENWPTLGRTRDFSFSISDESTIHRPTDSANPRTNPNNHTDDESIDGHIDDIEATCAPPEYTASFGSAIAAALSNASHVKGSRKSIPVPNNGRNANGGGGGGGKKKKNNNKTVLFSTGGRTFDGN